jgi:hypothetical protein
MKTKKLTKMNLDSKIKELKKKIDEEIGLFEVLNLRNLCKIPENEYINDLKVDFEFKHEEANENEYSDYIDGWLKISYNFLNEKANENVKVILEVGISSNKTYDCREIVDKYSNINLQVISDTSQKIANLREQLKILLFKMKSISGLNFREEIYSYLKDSKTEAEQDPNIQREDNDSVNNEIRRLNNEIGDLKKKNVDYELNDEQGYFVINHKKKMHFSKVAGALVPSADNWEGAINCVFKYVENLPFDSRTDNWLHLMKRIKYVK